MPSTLHLTLTEYDRMIDRGAFDHLQRKIELIHGELIEMNPAGPLHDYLITYLSTWSGQQLDPTHTLLTSQTGLNLLDQASRPEPDLMWLRKGNYRVTHPAAGDVQLAIEVADSSLEYDLTEKRKLYASAGIIEYWIVDAAASVVHVFTNPKSEDYLTKQSFQIGDTIAPTVAPTAKLSLKDLFEG
jgi:Uma2 family endonuclease